MSIDVKICGLNEPKGYQAAVNGGAKFTGFVFYPPSPRFVTPQMAADIVGQTVTSGSAKKVALFVDPTDDELKDMLAVFKPDLIQLHGAELPERIAAIRALTQKQVIKALKIGAEADLREVKMYESVADYLMFDAKPFARKRAAKNAAQQVPLQMLRMVNTESMPFSLEDIDDFESDSVISAGLTLPTPRGKAAAKGKKNYLPGGNGESFDWTILNRKQFSKPWFLAGGIRADNLYDAVGITGAKIVDVSSGVEDSPGKKDPIKISTFLALAASI